MHSIGVIGVQFLHLVSSDFKVSVRLRLFSVFQIDDGTVIMFFPLYVRSEQEGLMPIQFSLGKL